MSSELSFEQIAPVYNDAVNASLAKLYLGDANLGPDIGAMSDQEFMEMRLTGDLQPINPARVLANKMDADPETLTYPQINEFLHEAWREAQAAYAEHGVDPLPSIQAIVNIITHTEGYITGYSREIGILAARVLATNPKFTGPTRWHTKTWVVDEDGHDRIAQLQNQATGLLLPNTFFDEHRIHMVKGIHVAVENPIQTNAFLTTQEGLTVPSYTGESTLLGPILGILPGEVRKNEAQHFSFYRRLMNYLLDYFPDETVIAIYDANVDFEMPGKEGIPDYEGKSMSAAIAGALDRAKTIGVQRNIIKQLNISGRQFVSDEAKTAQEALVDPEGQFSEKAQLRAQRGMDAARRRQLRFATSSGELMPAIIGLTVDKDSKTQELTFPLAA